MHSQRILSSSWLKFFDGSYDSYLPSFGHGPFSPRIPLACTPVHFISSSTLARFSDHCFMASVFTTLLWPWQWPTFLLWPPPFTSPLLERNYLIEQIYHKTPSMTNSRKGTGLHLDLSKRWKLSILRRITSTCLMVNVTKQPLRRTALNYLLQVVDLPLHVNWGSRSSFLQISLCCQWNCGHRWSNHP
jgi:hypothetical protein